ncbi:MAG: threonine/serine dehydratase [Caldilineaceae bacterium]|nr:threonine/serine dehydratase [Caldilineaceae bacterium]
MAASPSRLQTNGAAKLTDSNKVQRHPTGLPPSAADLPRHIRLAAGRIRPHVVQTPLLLSPALSDHTGAHVYLKLENRQHTGSFKLRGATNKLLNLPAEDRARGVVTASTGNHALAVARAAAQLDIAATIYLPEGASPRKVEKLESFPVTLCRVPGDALNAEISARAAAQQRNQPFISPYNDPHIIAGQGTIAVELLRQQPQLDAVFVTVGGGGLMGGIASHVKATASQIQTVGCQPQNSAVMLASVRAGRIVDTASLPTLSDGSAGGIEPQSITFDLCRLCVDDWLTVSEDEIAAAMRLIFHEIGESIEGAAGVAVASLLKTGKRFAGQRLAVVICGGNVDSDTWQRVLEQKI